jgi:hypothetical protein
LQLSVVMIVGRRRARGEAVLRALAAQTARDRLEVVAVDLRADRDPPLRLPPGCRVVDGVGCTAAGARAAGLEATGGPFVAFIEDHCYPAPGWAEAVLAGFATGASAVGYAMAIANPERIAARVDGWAQVGGMLYPDRDGPHAFLTAGNVAYRRDALEGRDGLLENDFLLQQELRQAGGTLLQVTRADVAHEHFSRWRDNLAATTLAARCLAAARIRHGGWTRRRRLAAALAVLPVAPAKRVAAMARRLAGRPDLRRMALPALPGVLVVFGLAAVAEASGYLFPGADEARLMHYEFDVERVEP